jgi:hypothetical protein
MTPQRAKEMLPILQAIADGKPTQYRIKGTGLCGGWDGQWSEWRENQHIEINFGKEHIQYRIKPEVIKYRRFIHRIGNGDITVKVAMPDWNIKGWETCKDFVRWIDNDWQEVEV